jgi:hypothetical protein
MQHSTSELLHPRPRTQPNDRPTERVLPSFPLPSLLSFLLSHLIPLFPSTSSLPSPPRPHYSLPLSSTISPPRPVIPFLLRSISSPFLVPCACPSRFTLHSLALALPPLPPQIAQQGNAQHTRIMSTQHVQQGHAHRPTTIPAPKEPFTAHAIPSYTITPTGVRYGNAQSSPSLS